MESVAGSLDSPFSLIVGAQVCREMMRIRVSAFLFVEKECVSKVVEFWNVGKLSSQQEEQG